MISIDSVLDSEDDNEFYFGDRVFGSNFECRFCTEFWWRNLSIWLMLNYLKKDFCCLTEIDMSDLDSYQRFKISLLYIRTTSCKSDMNGITITDVILAIDCQSFVIGITFSTLWTELCDVANQLATCSDIHT